MRRRARVQIAVATLSGNSLRQTVHEIVCFHKCVVRQTCKRLVNVWRPVTERKLLKKLLNVSLHYLVKYECQKNGIILKYILQLMMNHKVV